MKDISKLNSLKLIQDLKLAKLELVSTKKIIDKKDKHTYPITEKPFQIPENWNWVFLSDISIIQEGPGLRKHQYTDEGVQFLTVTNILEGSIDLLKSKKYISENEYESKYKHYTINKGDILNACSGATWGKSAIYESNQVLMLNTSTLRLRFFNDLGNNKYLYYLTKTRYFKSNLASHSTGQQPNYGYSHYSKIPVPIPPLEEQKQIVAILDQAFAAIDQAKANIEKNIANAKEICDSKKEEIFDKLSLMINETPLEDVCDKIFAGGDAPKENFSKGKTDELTIPIIANAVKDNGLYGYTNKARVTKPSITVAARGSGTGHTEYRDYPFVPIVRLIVLTPNTEIIDVEFLMQGIKNLTITRSGSAIPQLTVPMIKSYSIPVPSKEKQTIIVEALNQVEKEITDYNLIQNQKLINLEELKKSILQKAFAGELSEPVMIND